VAAVETLVAGRILMTPHATQDYPGLMVVRPGPLWSLGLLVVEDGQSFLAKGGERVYPYETRERVRADGFELRAGDRVTLVRSGLPAFLVEWRIERAGGAPSSDSVPA
jgi:hypothetical protein